MSLEKIKAEIDGKEPTADMPVKVVAIDGHGGTGKSTLAEKLARVLQAEILHTDDFASWDNPLDWWPRLIDEALEPIKSGAKSLRYERGAKGPEHSPKPVRDQPVTPIMILEGVSSARKEFRPYLSYTIWLEASKEVYVKRSLERDGEQMSEQLAKGLAEEDAYIARDRPQDYADAIVSDTD